MTELHPKACQFNDDLETYPIAWQNEALTAGPDTSISSTLPEGFSRAQFIAHMESRQPTKLAAYQKAVRKLEKEGERLDLLCSATHLDGVNFDMDMHGRQVTLYAVDALGPCGLIQVELDATEEAPRNERVSIHINFAGIYVSADRRGQDIGFSLAVDMQCLLTQIIIDLLDKQGKRNSAHVYMTAQIHSISGYKSGQALADLLGDMLTVGSHKIEFDYALED